LYAIVIIPATKYAQKKIIHGLYVLTR